MQTADFLLLYDQLFDSVNGSQAPTEEKVLTDS